MKYFSKSFVRVSTATLNKTFSSCLGPKSFQTPTHASFSATMKAKPKPPRTTKKRTTKRFPRKQQSLRVWSLNHNASMRIMEHLRSRQPSGAKPKVLQQMATGVAVVQAINGVNDGTLSKDGAGDVNVGPVVEQDVIEHGVEEEGGVNSLTIIVKSKQLHDHGVVYEVRDDETFEEIYGDYASRLDLSAPDIILKKQGLIIAPTDTVARARIRTGDIIYVHGVDPTRNMNTRFKFFYIRNTCTPPHEVMVYGKLTSKLWRLFEKWASEVDKDPNCLKLMHQDKNLSRRENIWTSGD